MSTDPFDASIVGSGATGGWVAKELAEVHKQLRAPTSSIGALAIGVLTMGVAVPAWGAAGAPTCAALATDPAYGIIGDPAIKSATSVVVPPSGRDVAYCKVTLLYGTNSDQNITIALGLPLSAADGGSGGVQGAWNGRTEGLGGGGCAGNLNVIPGVNAGYVGSGNDLGHSGGDCTPGVNPDGTYNLQFIQDFIRNGIKQQVLWSKFIARVYYGMDPEFNYWNGCSTGGRQGYLLAQELPDELDGILANAPAMYWTRVQSAQMWGQIAMKDAVGEPIASGKLAQARASAVEACDANDGVVDGIIDDPRACHFSARSNICGAPGAPTTNCLTEQVLSPDGGALQPERSAALRACSGLLSAVPCARRGPLRRRDRTEPGRCVRGARELGGRRSGSGHAAGGGRFGRASLRTHASPLSISANRDA